MAEKKQLFLTPQPVPPQTRARTDRWARITAVLSTPPRRASMPGTPETYGVAKGKINMAAFGNVIWDAEKAFSGCIADPSIEQVASAMRTIGVKTPLCADSFYTVFQREVLGRILKDMPVSVTSDDLDTTLSVVQLLTALDVMTMDTRIVGERTDAQIFYLANMISTLQKAARVWQMVGNKGYDLSQRIALVMASLRSLNKGADLHFDDEQVPLAVPGAVGTEKEPPPPPLTPPGIASSSLYQYQPVEDTSHYGASVLIFRTLCDIVLGEKLEGRLRVFGRCGQYAIAVYMLALCCQIPWSNVSIETTASLRHCVVHIKVPSDEATGQIPHYFSMFVDCGSAGYGMFRQRTSGTLSEYKYRKFMSSSKKPQDTLSSVDRQSSAARKFAPMTGHGWSYTDRLYLPWLDVMTMHLGQMLPRALPALLYHLRWSVDLDVEVKMVIVTENLLQILDMLKTIWLQVYALADSLAPTSNLYAQVNLRLPLLIFMMHDLLYDVKRVVDSQVAAQLEQTPLFKSMQSACDWMQSYAYPKLMLSVARPFAHIWLLDVVHVGYESGMCSFQQMAKALLSTGHFLDFAVAETYQQTYKAVLNELAGVIPVYLLEHLIRQLLMSVSSIDDESCGIFNRAVEMQRDLKNMQAEVQRLRSLDDENKKMNQYVKEHVKDPSLALRVLQTSSMARNPAIISMLFKMPRSLSFYNLLEKFVEFILQSLDDPIATDDLSLNMTSVQANQIARRTGMIFADEGCDFVTRNLHVAEGLNHAYYTLLWPQTWYSLWVAEEHVHGDVQLAPSITDTAPEGYRVALRAAPPLPLSAEAKARLKSLKREKEKLQSELTESIPEVVEGAASSSSAAAADPSVSRVRREYLLSSHLFRRPPTK